MTDIIFSIASDTANGLVDPTLLSNEIVASGLPQAQKLETLGDVLTISHVPALTVPESGTLVGVVAAHSGIDFSTIDHPGPTGDIIQEAIDDHAAIPSAHHIRYSDAEASGIAVAVATTGIASHSANTDAHHTRYTDAEAIAASSGALDHHLRYTDNEASGVAVAVTTSGITTHASNSSAHHARYSDGEAIAAASGALDHHVRYTDNEASGVSVAVVTSGIQTHTAQPSAHHARYSDGEAIAAASGALDHHVRYTDNEASGVAVSVTTSGISTHAANAGAHHIRYTDAEAAIAATGAVTLQTAYDAGGTPPQIISNASNETVTLRGHAPGADIFNLQDNAGVVQHSWDRNSIFMGPAVGNILSASVSGINLSPSLFPERPTVNFTLDQLNILPSDRTITSNFVKISFSSTYTLDFPAASFGAALGLNATILLRQNGGPFGMGLLFNNAITWSNDSGFAVNLGAAFSFVDQPTYRADAASITQGLVRSMISQPRILTINGGTLALTTLQHYFAGGQILSGATVATRIGFDVFNVAPFTGSITTEHIGLRIGNLTDGGGGASIRGVQSNMNNGLFIEQLGTAPSEHGPEFRIGSTLAHIGDTDTNLTFTTDQIDLNASGVNLFRVFSNGTSDFVSVNPSLNDIDFFVNGDTVAGLIRTDAGIDGLGLFGAQPVAQSGNYITSNFSISRVLNGSGTTLNQVINVLSTLIEDMKSLGAVG